MREREIPELLLRCCGKILIPLNIIIFDTHVSITFFCPMCRTWVYLESRNSMKKRVTNFDLDKLDKQTNKNPSFKYIKKGEINGKN